MDRLADSITLPRSYGVQLWVFVQDLFQLKAVYPRGQSFLANTSQQFFGTGDYDTAGYLTGVLGYRTISYETRGSSSSYQGITNPGSVPTSSLGGQVQGRPLLTPDEVMCLGPTRRIVLVKEEQANLLDRVSYLTDRPHAGRFNPNPLHLPHAVQ